MNPARPLHPLSQRTLPLRPAGAPAPRATTPVLGRPPMPAASTPVTET